MHGAVRTVASLQGYRQWRKFMIWVQRHPVWVDKKNIFLDTRVWR